MYKRIALLATITCQSDADLQAEALENVKGGIRKFHRVATATPKKLTSEEIAKVQSMFDNPGEILAQARNPPVDWTVPEKVRILLEDDDLDGITLRQYVYVQGVDRIISNCADPTFLERMVGIDNRYEASVDFLKILGASHLIEGAMFVYLMGQMDQQRFPFNTVDFCTKVKHFSKPPKAVSGTSA
jgi:hypothetical protein